MSVSIRQRLQLTSPVQAFGTIREAAGPVLRASLQAAAIGDEATVYARDGQAVPARVVGFADSLTVLSPLGASEGILRGARVETHSGPAGRVLRPELLGSVVDAFGTILSPAAEPPQIEIPRAWRPLNSPAPGAMERRAVERILETGIPAIDGFTTLGRGQRIGIFAEPGVGKSSLLRAIAKNSKADVCVLSLIGERSREIAEIAQSGIGPRTVIIASSSAEPAATRLAAALTAFCIAEYFRDAGLDVLLQLDSLTRLFRAYREIGLAAGEIPGRRGYPPSVFAALPQLIERAGALSHGSITALFTVLLSEDLEEDPMVDEVKGLLDGHIVLSRQLAERAQYPAIDVLRSLSRLASSLLDSETLKATGELRSLMAQLEETEQSLRLGAEAPESYPAAKEISRKMQTLLCGGLKEAVSAEETFKEIRRLSVSLTKKEARRD